MMGLIMGVMMRTRSLGGFELITNNIKSISAGIERESGFDTHSSPIVLKNKKTERNGEFSGLNIIETDITNMGGLIFVEITELTARFTSTGINKIGSITKTFLENRRSTMSNNNITFHLTETDSTTFTFTASSLTINRLKLTSITSMEFFFNHVFESHIITDTSINTGLNEFTSDTRHKTRIALRLITMGKEMLFNSLTIERTEGRSFSERLNFSLSITRFLTMENIKSFLLRRRKIANFRTKSFISISARSKIGRNREILTFSERIKEIEFIERNEGLFLRGR